MAAGTKFDFEVAVAFGTQTAEGTYNSTLDGISSTLSYTQGLVLGDSQSGIKESGLTLGLERGLREKALIGSTFTRNLSDFLKAEVPTFTFAFPFVGNRADADGGPADSDGTPIAGVDALLEGAGMIGAAWGLGVGWRYEFSDAVNPISALVYISGMRLELLDCRSSMSIDFTPGSIPIATATLSVGSIKDQSLYASLPTPTWGEQASVSAPVVENIGNEWEDTRGFSAGTLNINNSLAQIDDSNAPTGEVVENTGRETTFDATLFASSTVDKGYEYSQLTATAEGTLDQLSFQVGSSMTAGNPAKAVEVVIPKPELTTQAANALGTKAAYDISVSARGAAAGSGNDELFIYFR